MKKEIAQEVKDALTVNPEVLVFEKIQGEDSSPLNLPVVEKDIGGEKPAEIPPVKNANIWKPELNTPQEKDSPETFRTVTEEQLAQEKAQEPLDAPEQEINATSEDTLEEPTEEMVAIPVAQANQAADALLGMTNNLLEVGGGYFVKLKKHEAFYEFDEIITLIDEQNGKNVQRIKLDKEDQALLKPLLAQVLRKKSKQLTPEQQFMGAILSILMKKAQVVMEVRAENALLESRILQIVKDEKELTPEDISEANQESTKQADEVDDEEALELEVEEIENPLASALEVNQTTKTAS